jgi:hypothetical protein
MHAALAFLRTHPKVVSPITLTLWGNDVIPAFDDCGVTRSCVRSRAPSVIASLANRLGSILCRLRAEAPGARIIVTGAWNFDPDRLWLTNVLYHPLNRAVANAAAAAKPRFADVLPLFNPKGSTAAQKARLCAYTFICSKGEPHPTDAGYRTIATAILAASGYGRGG